MRGGNAFTLIEMLVVIAIIGILASMLSEPLVSSIDSGRGAACFNLTKQYQTATLMYSNDNDGMLIDGFNYLSEEGGLPIYMNETKTMSEDYTRCPDDGTTEELGRLWKNSNFGNIKVSIGCNTMALSDSKRATRNGPMPFWAKVQQIKNPSQTMQWGDWQAGSGDTSDIETPRIKPTDNSLGFMAFRHKNTTSATYADGHTSTIMLILGTENDGHDFADGENWISATTSIGKWYKEYTPFYGPCSTGGTTKGVWGGLVVK